MVSYIVMQDQINVTVAGQLFQVTRTPSNVEKIDALVTDAQNGVDGAQDELLGFVQPGQRIALETDGRFERDQETGSLFLEGDDRPIPDGLGRRIIDFLDQGLNVEPLVNFWKNCRLNPNPESVNMLWEFLKNNGHPITPEGLFIGYKVVKLAPYFEQDEDGNAVQQGFSLRKDLREQADQPYVTTTTRVDPDTGEQITEEIEISPRLRFVDRYSGTIDNSIGETPEMDRDEVVFNPNRTCAEGLHVASFEYLPHYGASGNNLSAPEGTTWGEMSANEIFEAVRTQNSDPVVEVLVHPADVVSVPTDYNRQKMRTCRYHVHSLVNGERDESFSDIDSQGYAQYVEDQIREELNEDIAEEQEDVDSLEGKKQFLQ